jgi:S1-C subfamily serine protease
MSEGDNSSQWIPDPLDPNILREWDGTQWTGLTNEKKDDLIFDGIDNGLKFFDPNKYFGHTENFFMDSNTPSDSSTPSLPAEGSKKSFPIKQEKSVTSQKRLGTIFAISLVAIALSLLGINAYQDHKSNLALVQQAQAAQQAQQAQAQRTQQIQQALVSQRAQAAQAAQQAQQAQAAQQAQPANPPDNLVSLTSKVTQSVVTVLCDNSLGSGWAIPISFDKSETNAGYRAYIITNYHVISGCTTARDITIVLANQTKVPAYVSNWDEANDVAGIRTKTYIPPLDWRGATPQQGWWVGIIGSPLGLPGVLTTGIISSNNISTFIGTTTAAINHGNSGGPVFDRTGRVVGLATAYIDGAESFGIFKGAPLLCEQIMVCTPNQIWSGTVP